MLWEISNQILGCLIGEQILGQVPLCLMMQFVYQCTIWDRGGKEEVKLGHGRLVDNTVAFASHFFFCGQARFPSQNQSILTSLPGCWMEQSSGVPFLTVRLSGSLGYWSEFLCFCVQGFRETAGCTDVMSLSPAPITWVFSLIIVCGWQTCCQSPAHPKSFGEGVHYDHGLQ